MSVSVSVTESAARRGRKFDQVLAGARAVFMRDGYEGASVDDIARQAGVSKATLYSYFADKRLLFVAVARAECRRQADEALELIDQDQDCEAVLREAGRRMIAFMTSDFGIRMFRICVAESDRFPGIGQEYYQSGPMIVRQRLAAFLTKAVARGDLAIEDIDLAADQFAELCKADLQTRLLFGAGPVGARAQRRTLDGAVATFLARYGRRGRRQGTPGTAAGNGPAP